MEEIEKLPEKYVIDCPKCGATFDVKGYLENWKIGLIHATSLLQDIKEIYSQTNNRP